jgi:RNase P subunit RPR2
LGFKKRERRRRKRVAQVAAQSASRRSGSSASRWWLTPVRTKTCCARCGLVLSPGRGMVYRHEPRESLCHPCADGGRVPYRTSLRWERKRKGKTA